MDQKEKLKFEQAKINITENPDGECLPIQCICGYGKDPWTFIIGIYCDLPKACPRCGREYYFSQKITVFVKKEKK